MAKPYFLPTFAALFGFLLSLPVAYGRLPSNAQPLIDSLTNEIEPFSGLCPISIDAFTGNIILTNMNVRMSTLYPALRNATFAQLSECFDPNVGVDANIHMFNLTVIEVMIEYYKNFPENFALEKLSEKVVHLFDTMNTISRQTVICLTTPRPYKLGFNQLSDWPVKRVKSLSGATFSQAKLKLKYAKRPKSRSKRSRATSRARRQQARHKRANEPPVEEQCLPTDKSPPPETLDYRAQGKVTPVKYQDDCGSCWAFASVSVLESAYLIKGKTKDENFDLSEQQLIACGPEKGCTSGGTAVDAYNFIMSNLGITAEKILPYNIKSPQCDKSKKKKRAARVKDYCLRGVHVSVDGKPEKLSDEDIMLAIRQFGPVYASINGEDSESLRHYKSGVYDYDACPKKTNHAVSIVGWDKDAWIIKNSWSDRWGEGGYLRMKRGKNMCGINTYIAYPLV